MKPNTKYRSDLQHITIPLNKGIDIKSPYGNEGQMEDMINLKPDEAGILRPIRSYSDDENLLSTDYHVYIHKRTGFTNYIYYKESINEITYKNKLTDLNPTTLITLEAGEEVYSIKPFLNYLIITTSDRMLKFLYTNGSYTSININLPLSVRIDTSNQTDVYTDLSDAGDYDALYANLISKINSESESGRLTGAISWRAAYKLIDGSYLMITAPKIIGENLGMTIMLDGTQYKTKFSVCNYKAQVTPAYYDVLEEEKEIISSIVIFFSKQIIKNDIEQLYSEDYAILDTGITTLGTQLVSFNELSDDFKNIGSPGEGWFQACEIPFTNIIDKRNTSFDQGDNFMRIDDWYQTYASNISCPVDQYTHHALTAEELFVYNSRLWLARMKRTLATPFETIKFASPEDSYDPSEYEKLNVMIVFKINTGNSTKTVVELYENCFFLKDGDDYTLKLPIVAYPDQRAYEFSLFVYHDNVWKEFITNQRLEVSLSHNFSYYFPCTNNLTYEVGPDAQLGIEHTVDLSAASVTEADNYAEDNEELIGEDQFQLSELSNPLIFPSLYNYTAGNSTINWFAVSTNPISEGQYGQYPVIISTNNGIYAANIGTGEVIITNVTPIAPDISISQPASSINGVFFCTKKGIMVIQGNKVLNISKQLEGRKSDVIDSDEGGSFLYYSSHSQVVQLNSVINNKDNYIYQLEDMVLGYDYRNDRLLVSKSTINHSLVYDISTGQWYRIPQKFYYFTDSYPDLLASTGTKLVNLSELIQDDDEDHPNIQTHFHTKIINVGVNNRKRINDIILRCSIKTEDNRYPVFAVFASNDNKKWSLITGGGRMTGQMNDIHVTRTHASYKFYVFAFWADLNPDFDNRIESIDIIIQEKYKHKKRSY